MAGWHLLNPYDKLLGSPLGLAGRVQMAEQQVQRPKLVAEAKSVDDLTGRLPAHDVHRLQRSAHVLRQVLEPLQVSVARMSDVAIHPSSCSTASVVSPSAFACLARSSLMNLATLAFANRRAP